MVDDWDRVRELWQLARDGRSLPSSASQRDRQYFALIQQLNGVDSAAPPHAGKRYIVRPSSNVDSR